MEKILLVLLPYWTPLMPPLGISCMKSFLQQHGCTVKTKDVNTNDEIKEIYDEYFHTLKEYIPAGKQGNFYNIGTYVWQDHMMAYINHTGETAYEELVKEVVNKTFFVNLNKQQVITLNRKVHKFYCWLEDYFTALLEEEKPSVLGLSVYSGTLPASLFAFRLTREKYPRIKTVMGGGIFAEPLAPGSPNLEFFLEKTKTYIDKIIIGEGEILLLKYIRGQLPETQRVYTLEDINREIVDLSRVTIPELADFQLEKYPYLGAYASRSCPYQCSFCSEAIQWGPYRKKKARHIVEELKQLYHKHGNQLVLMGDSLLNPIITDLAREMEKIRESLYWDGYLRADQAGCDTENTMLWRRGGFYRARLGLESGSPAILESMGKKITLLQIKTALASLAYAGIKTTTYWVIGYPGETKQDFQQTLQLIEELKDEIYEADCNAFAYFPAGQTNSTRWAKTYKSHPLYPAWTREMLTAPTWIMDCPPTREDIYQRVNQFVQHIQKLKIPNPYFLHEIYEADKRWKKLHKNAVPPIIEFLTSRETDTYIDENKKIEPVRIAGNILDDSQDNDFAF